MSNGLSPLTRGTRSASPPLVIKLGFIPADAGNTICEMVWRLKVAVYPR
ncbi:hypothetical protein AD39_3211 [Escherichia coli 1-182-04_S4_C3]|nr:hypothetical protein AD39_3211 [Escherichia coli 1-182-04_S4_C3]